MRTFYIVRIFHPLEELGTMSGPFQQVEQMELGRQKATMRRVQKEKNFRLMAEKVVQLRFNRIYMDGFPAEQAEVEILLYNNFIEKQFPTFLLIASLVQKGAILMGTEDPELLREEYQYLQEVARVVETQELPEGDYSWLEKMGQDILKRRDDFIAARIDSTLKDGETGVLFIGAMHQVEKRLPDDIQIVRL